ncbi:fibronectin-binding protein [Turneriella parva]|nr:fibronectin-binding protein [Turneriella parva]
MKKSLNMLFCCLALTVGGFAQNYSECQAPNAHMNPNCNGSAPAAGAFQGGSYAVQGSTPEGTRYEGSVVISGDATSGFHVVWTIGSETYEGTGTLSGTVLTVDWGQAEPVVYKIVGGGAILNGKWGKRGRGREKLTRQ